MKKNGIVALLPIGIFLLLFAGAGIITGDFYSMPAIVAFLIALLVAFLQNREKPFAEKMSIVTKGIGDENIVTMIFIFLLAGAFSGIVSAAGGVDSTVNFGLSIIPSKLAIVGLFLVSCFISISMGTSVGTIAALAPIALGIAEKTEFALPLCIGAVVSGAMFGDNLSMISDTTIAAVRTQGCEMKDKFRENIVIVLPAAILTIILLLVQTGDAQFIVEGNLEYNFFQIVPYLVVLIGAVIGFNVFLVLISGIIISIIVGLITGSFAIGEVFTILGSGVTSMYDITVISITVAAIVALVKENGGIQYILDGIKKRINSPKGGQFGIAGLGVLVDLCTANNTVAIVIAGPIAKDVANEYGISGRRSASILDIFTSVTQGLIPYGAQLLTAASAVGITPFAIIPNLYYPILMAISALLFMGFVRER